MDYAALGEEIAILVNEAIGKATAPLLARIATLEAREAIPGPQGERGPEGPQGAAGRDGRDGLSGEKGIDGKDGRDGIDGKDGRDGADGRDGLNGLQGEKGIDGKDGRDGVDGANGRDGLDGLGFDDLSVEHDGERGVTIKFQRGDLVKAFPLHLPLVLDRGFYVEGKEYEVGDGTTFGGSYWIAQAQTRSKPGIGNPDWRLAVKKGRDARGERLT